MCSCKYRRTGSHSVSFDDQPQNRHRRGRIIRAHWNSGLICSYTKSPPWSAYLLQKTRNDAGISPGDGRNHLIHFPQLGGRSPDASGGRKRPPKRDAPIVCCNSVTIINHIFEENEGVEPTTEKALRHLPVIQITIALFYHLRIIGYTHLRPYPSSMTMAVAPAHALYPLLCA